MLRRVLAASTLILLASGTLAAVLCYNLWSWCCVRCTVATFLCAGPFGLLLLGFNALAALLLLLLRRRRPPVGGSCRCGTPLATGWLFCPCCGAARPS
jgi:hypothetical protein